MIFRKSQPKEERDSLERRVRAIEMRSEYPDGKAVDAQVKRLEEEIARKGHLAFITGGRAYEMSTDKAVKELVGLLRYRFERGWY